jgi:hypothetical protein
MKVFRVRDYITPAAQALSALSRIFVNDLLLIFHAATYVHMYVDLWQFWRPGLIITNYRY